MLTAKKVTAFTKTHVMLPDVPSPAMSALEIKQWWDSASEEQRVAFNALIDNLLSTATGDSGAESIGIEPIVGVSAANVQNALEQLKLSINSAVTGSIPDGSLTPAKLSFDPATQPELDTHVSDFTTHVEYALATGTANTYAVTLTPTPTAYTRGMAVSVEINALNTGTSTININGLGAKLIKKSNGNDVAAGNLKVGIIYTLRYNGTNFILQGEGGEYGTAGAAQVLTGFTVGTENGVVSGTYSNIKSKQNGAATWGSANTTMDITIGNVDPQKSIIKVTFSTVLTSQGRYLATAPLFVNESTIRLTRNSAAAEATSIYWEVIEFNNVKSKQIGVKSSPTGTSEDIVNVSVIDGSKSILYAHNTSIGSSAISADNYLVGYRIISPTTIGLTSDNKNTLYWQLIEFN